MDIIVIGAGMLRVLRQRLSQYRHDLFRPWCGRAVQAPQLPGVDVHHRFRGHGLHIVVVGKARGDGFHRLRIGGERGSFFGGRRLRTRVPFRQRPISARSTGVVTAACCSACFSASRATAARGAGSIRML